MRAVVVASAALALAIGGARPVDLGAADDDGGIELRVAGHTATMLVRASRSVYRYRWLPASTDFASPAFTASRVNTRRELVAGPPQLGAPTAIAIDESERIYIADASGPAVYTVGADETTLTTLYNGPGLSWPIGMAVGDDGRVYVLDGTRREIVSLAGGDPIPEFPLDDAGKASEAGTLFSRSGAVWAVDRETGSVLRLFGVAPTRQIASFSPRSLRAGETLVFRQLADRRPLAGHIAVGGDALWVLDPRARRLVAITLGEGAPLALDYGPSLKDPAALALADDGMYFVERGDLRLSRAPILAAVTAYFEAGLPSENVVSFYEYLSKRRVLPMRSYVLQRGDNIAELATNLNLLPGSFTESFERLLCTLNTRFCQGAKIPDRYFPGQTIELPDVQPARYLGRRSLNLPIDAHTSEALASRRLTSVGDVSRFFAPITAQQPDTLRAAVESLNYGYRGENLLKETTGTFILPIDAVRMRVLVPTRDLANPLSELNRLASRNVRIVPSSLRLAAKSVGGARRDQDLPANQPGLPWLVAPSTDDRCEKYDPRVYTRVHELINYCVPKGTSSTSATEIAIIDNRFDPNHPEFLVAGVTPPQSRLHLHQMSTTNVQRHPLTNDLAQNFDRAIDHGTHIAGLIAGRNATGQMAGIHPTLTVNATDAAHAKELFDTLLDVHICNISLGSDGASGGGGPPDDLKVLQALVEDTAYRGILFVISAGNEGKAIDKNTLGFLGTQSNVIVVGASSFERLPAFPPYSNYDSRYVHIVAPGNLIKSSIFGGGYGIATGTSQATALVSGTAAFLGRPGAALQPWQIKERLLSTVDLWLHKNGNSDKVFSGMLNMKRALLDTDTAVFTFAFDHRVVKGTLTAADAARYLVVKPADRASPGGRFRYGDIRRLVRNADGTFNVIYSEQTDPRDPASRVLHRLIDIRVEQFVADSSTELLQFTIRKAGASTEVIELTALEDFVNAVF